MTDKLRFIAVAVFIALGIMVTSCTTGAGEQGSTSSETSGSATAAEATMDADEHEAEADEHGDEHENEAHEHEAEAEMLMLPAVNATELNGKPLRVIATTGIIGDVVAQVGGDTIDLTVMMEPGQDPTVMSRARGI